jgi:hypothetical protein
MCMPCPYRTKYALCTSEKKEEQELPRREEWSNVTDNFVLDR